MEHATVTVRLEIDIPPAVYKVLADAGEYDGLTLPELVCMQIMGVDTKIKITGANPANR